MDVSGAAGPWLIIILVLCVTLGSGFVGFVPSLELILDFLINAYVQGVCDTSLSARSVIPLFAGMIPLISSIHANGDPETIMMTYQLK